MARDVTQNQQTILNAVFALKAEMKKWPTYRELAQYTGFPLSYVYVSIKSLCSKNKLYVRPRKHRGIRGVEKKK